MAPWLALTTDGMLLSALVVIGVRRHPGEHVMPGPGRLLGRAWPRTSQQRGRPRWASSSHCGRRFCLTSALEPVALVASPANKQPIVTNATPAAWAANAPVDAWFRSADGEVMDCCGQPDESWLATAAGPARCGSAMLLQNAVPHLGERLRAVRGEESPGGQLDVRCPGAARVLTRSAGCKARCGSPRSRVPYARPVPARGAGTCPRQARDIPQVRSVRSGQLSVFIRVRRHSCLGACLVSASGSAGAEPAGCSLWAPVSCPASLVSGARSLRAVLGGHMPGRRLGMVGHVTGPSRQAECP
jgi:hypothetical protein